MSKGPGRVEREIERLFREDPQGCFTVEDLAVCTYPGINQPSKVHRVAVLRAARSVCRRLNWSATRANGLAGQTIFFNTFDPLSLARSQIRRADIAADRAQIEGRLSEHDEQQAVAPGGIWWLHVQRYKALEAGDEASAERLSREIHGAAIRRVDTARPVRR